MQEKNDTFFRINSEGPTAQDDGHMQYKLITQMDRAPAVQIQKIPLIIAEMASASPRRCTV